MRDSFVFYRSFREAIKHLPKEEQLSVYNAIADYSLDGEIADLQGIAMAVFTLIKPLIDANQKRYESGKKGGRPKAENKPIEKQEESKPENKPKQSVTNGKPKDNQERTNLKPNEDVNVNVNEDVNDINNKKHSSEPCIYNQIIDHLNLKAGTSYKNTSKATKTKIKARLNEGYTLDDFIAVIDSKCLKWLNDEQMNQYLRPSTLFGSRFEEYLNGKASNQGAVGVSASNTKSKFVNYDQPDRDYDELERLAQERLLKNLNST